MAQSCVFCGNQVVWNKVMATREGMRVADIADSRGLLALEEKQQYIHMGMVCGPCCDGKHTTPKYVSQWGTEYYG